MKPRKKSWLRYIPLFIGVMVVGAVGVGLVLFVQSMMQPAPAQKKMIRTVTLVQPPPPPPPPKVEKPPEPEIEEEVEIDEPEVMDEMPEDIADDTPVGEDLALDAEGVAGGDVFGLLAKKGGRDLIGSGGGLHAWYANTIQSDILDYLSENTEIRKRQYTVKVKLWVDKAGRIRRSKMLGSTGDRELDKQLKAALDEMKRFSEAPPEDLPQPIYLKVTSRI
jgi:protein TonB